jgi:HMG box factor
MYSGKMDSPRTAPPYAQGYRRGPHSQPQQLHTHHENDEDVDLLNPTSDPKRRRFSNEPHFQRSYASSTSPMSYTSAQLFARSGIPISATSHRTPYSGGLSLLARPGNMDPPAQRSPVGPKSQHQYPTRGNTFDESLRLPPLKTQLPSQNQLSSQRADLWSNDRDSEARSVEAMVMTIPYVNKIKVLAKISPPLPPPGPKSPAQQTRGVLIAIEGVDGSLLAETGSFLNKYLGKDSSCAIKTWSNYPAPSRSPMGGSPGLDAEMAGTVSKLANLSSIDGSIAQNAFVEYLSIISEWHKKSQEIARYITTAPTLSPIGSNNSSSAFPIVPKTFPVAILPQGFSLTTSDSFAVRIPINDSYAPADHWQWMATLWRGIIGPDLTIYVKRVDREELERYGGVEIRADCAGIIIRVLELGSIDEKTARRLGFEVMEFIRGVENSSILLDPTSKKSGT